MKQQNLIGKSALVTLDDLEKTTEVKKCELRVKFENLSNKENKKETPAAIEKLIKEKGVKLSGTVHDDKVISYDSKVGYGVAIRDIYRDEYGGTAGLSREIVIYVIDVLKNKIIKEDGPHTYRNGRDSQYDNDRIAYKEVLILKEDGKSITIGLKSYEELAIQVVDKVTNQRTTAKSYDLSAERKEVERIKSAEKAINQLSIDDLREVVASTYICKQVIKTHVISDTAVLIRARQYDGDETNQDLFLALKNSGILKLGSVSFENHPSPKSADDYNTIDLDTVKITFFEKTFVIKGVLRKYTKVYMGESKTLQKQEFSFEVDASLDQTAFVKRNLQFSIEKIKNKYLKAGNTGRIAIKTHGLKEVPDNLTNYAYSVQEIVDFKKNRAFIILAKIIDLTYYSNGECGVLAIGAQLNTSLYEISSLNTESTVFKNIGDITTPSSDRHEYAPYVHYDSESKEMRIKPNISHTKNALKVRFDVKANEKKFTEKVFTFDIK